MSSANQAVDWAKTTTDDVRRSLRLPHGMQAAVNRWAFDPAAWAKDVFGVELTPWQKRYVRFYGIEMHARAGRQSGKSFSEAVRKSHRMTFLPGSRHLNTARTYHQALIIPDELMNLCERSPLARHMIVDVDRSPFYVLHWRTGAEYWARSVAHGGDNVRGIWADSAHEDEAAFGSKYDQTVIRPTLVTTGGPFSTTTTPNGLNFWFHDYTAADNEQGAEERRRGLTKPDLDTVDGTMMLDHLALWWKTTDNPFLTKRAIQQIAKGLSPDARDQELDAEFRELHGALCTADDLKPVEDGGIRNDDLAYTENEIIEGRRGRRPITIRHGLQFVCGVDLGKWKSYTAAIVLRVDVTPWELTEVYAKRRPVGGWPEMQADIEEITERFQAATLVDATRGSVGDVLVDYLAIPHERFEFFKASKEQLLLNLKLAIQDRKLHLYYDEELFRQLGLYGTDPDATEGRRVAHTEETWDYLMALALAVWQADKGAIGVDQGAVSGARIVPGLVARARVFRPLSGTPPWRRGR